MKTTIDQAGRLVIPKRLREQLHLSGGSTVEILPDQEDGLLIRLAQSTGRLIDKEGVLVQQGDAVASFGDELRIKNDER